MTMKSPCPDYRHNGLNTCKHIEKTLGYLRQNYRRQWPELEKSDRERVEILLDQREQKKVIINGERAQRLKQYRQPSFFVSHQL